MAEISRALQDPMAARSFERTYDDFIERNMPRKLLEGIVDDANQAADQSVLAASVASHVAFEIDKGTNANDPDRAKERAIIDAKRAADAVIELDSFIRNPANKHEPVIYALQEYDRPDDVPDYLQLHFTIAAGTTVASRKGTKSTYYVEPKIMYGVPSPIIANGWALPRPPLDGTRSYDFTNNSAKSTFNKYTYAGYEDISRGAMWPHAYRLPSFICGTDKLLEMFTKIVDVDYLKGYTEHRHRRASYVLLRSANYIGHAVTNDMFELADKSGIIPVWQSQVTDDYALKTVGILEKLRESQKTVLQFTEKNYIGLINGDAPAIEIETLAVTPNQIIERTQMHAKQRKLAATKADITAIVGVVLG